MFKTQGRGVLTAPGRDAILPHDPNHASPRRAAVRHGPMPPAKNLPRAREVWLHGTSENQARREIHRA